MLHLTERNFKTEVLEASQPTAVMFYARCRLRYTK